MICLTSLQMVPALIFICSHLGQFTLSASDLRPENADIHAPHPIHVSLCEVQYNAQTKKLEISLRVFTDDLELALEKTYGAKLLHIGTATERAEAVSHIQQYVLQHLKLAPGSATPLKLTYLGKEQEGLATWVYLESEPLPPFTTLQVTNTLLHALYDDQQNLVNVKVGGVIKSARLSKDGNGEKLVW